jgi:hypothetical protein
LFGKDVMSKCDKMVDLISCAIRQRCTDPHATSAKPSDTNQVKDR